MSYHTILRNSVEFTDGLRKARMISDNLTLTINISDVTVFPYRLVLLHIRTLNCVVNNQNFYHLVCSMCIMNNT